MKIERTKNAARNIYVGWFQSIYTMIWPFIFRTAMIYFLGVQYCGLNGLFTSILSVLNLAELGVGSAMVYSMYKPIAEDDTVKICALMRLYKIYYRIIGLVIGFCGLIIMPFIPHLVKGDIPNDLNIYILYLMNLGATVLTYWLFAYKNCLLSAHQRQDVNSKITMITNTVRYLLQILVMGVFHNYYWVLIIMLVTQIGNNILCAFIVSKMYPQYVAKGKMARSEVESINKRVKDLFTAKLGSVILNSADTVVISTFLGLTVLAVYQNYYALVTSVQSVIAVILGACTAGIGNSLVVETREKNFNDLKKLTFIIVWISGFCSCCFLCLFQPFMKIWMGKDLLLEMGLVICMVIYFYIYEINALLNLYKDAGGIWHSDRFRPLITALTNLGLNLIMVNFCGLYGILLSTVLSTLFVGFPWLIHNLFTTIFDFSTVKVYLRNLIKYTIIVVVTCVLTYTICSMVQLNEYANLAIRLLICCIVPNLIFFITLKKEKEFKEVIELLDTITKGKFKKYLFGK